MATVWVAGVDLEATLGFQLQDEPGVLDGAMSVPQEVALPGMRGAIIVGPYRTSVREFTLKGFLDGANQAAVRTNLKKLKALVGEGAVTVRVNDWSDVQTSAYCVDFNARAYFPQQVATPVAVEMVFRSPDPYWRDTSNQTPTFNTSHTDMPQGTAPAEPVLTSPVGVLTTPQLKGYDHNDVELWSCTLASLSSGEQYRITTAPGIMTVEKYTGGVWTSADSAITAGVFPKVLPSNGTAYQTSAWPKLSASAGTWTATYPKAWR